MAKAPKINLKQFRKEFAALRRKGLVSAPSQFFPGKQAPIRSVQPTKANLKAIEKFRDVLTGQAGTVAAKRVKKFSAAELAKIGAKKVKTPSGERILIEKQRDQKLRVEAGHIKLVRKHEEHIPLPELNVDEFRIDKLDPRLLPSPKLDEYWSAKIYGNKLRAEETFTSQEQLLDYLYSRYPHLFDPVTREFKDSVQYLQLYRLKRREDYWEMPGAPRGRKPRKYNPAKRKRQREQTAERTPEWLKKENRAKAAAKAREYRAQIKAKGGSQYEEQKRKARERAKRSRKNSN